MTNSPLQLEKVILRSISVEAITGQPDSGEVTVGTSLRLGQSEEDKSRWFVGLLVTLKKAPYTGHVAFDGYFKVHDVVPKEKVARLVAINGASILYGSARDYVALITSRSVHGEFLIPSISFSDLAAMEVTEKNGNSHTTPSPTSR